MKYSIIAVLALGALAACDTPVAPTAASRTIASAAASFTKDGVTRVNSWTPLDGMIYNTCNGDQVVITGRMHNVFTITTTATGSIFDGRTNTADVEGVGLTGTTYRFVQIYDQVVTFSAVPPFAFSFDDKQVLRVISEGAQPNELVDVTNLMSYDGTNFTFQQKYTKHCTP